MKQSKQNPHTLDLVFVSYETGSSDRRMLAGAHACLYSVADRHIECEVLSFNSYPLLRKDIYNWRITDK